MSRIIMFKLLVVLLVSANLFAFGPCDKVFPDGVSYSPSETLCDGKAAIIVYGKFANSYSAVVRDCNNDDRDPCHKTAKTCAANSASPYKAQTVWKAVIFDPRKNIERKGQVFCLKERGDSQVYKLVRRITIKLQNPISNPNQIAKICLNTRTKAVRPVTILSTYGFKDRRGVGYSANVCRTQGYLNCNISYSKICPKY